jgi:hypothetical protein
MGYSKYQIAILIEFLLIRRNCFVSCFGSSLWLRAVRSQRGADPFNGKARFLRICCGLNKYDFASDDNPEPSRRSFLQQTTLLPIIIGFAFTQSSVAMESPVLDASVEPPPSQEFVTRLPYATSIQALIPAIRVRKMTDQSVTLTEQWLAMTGDDAPQKRSEIVQQLQELLLQKQNFTNNIRITPSQQNDAVVGTGPVRSSTKPALPALSYLDLYNQKRKDLNLWEKPGAFFVQGGEIGTWKLLKRNEYSKEGLDEIRAALNLYTSNLKYTSTQYTLRVSKEERSQMIREDRLPDLLTQVIPSDMDLRDLYRNALLTAVQEARAELRYQVNDSNAATIDLTDLLHLLRQAQEALNQWFAFIDLNEIANAERADV